MTFLRKQCTGSPAYPRLCSTWFLIPTCLKKWASMQRLSCCWYSILRWTQWASRWVDDPAAQIYFSCRPNVQSSLGIQLVAFKLNFEHVHRVVEDKLCEIQLVWLLATLSNIFDFPLTLLHFGTLFWSL